MHEQNLTYRKKGGHGNQWSAKIRQCGDRRCCDRSRKHGCCDGP